MVFSCAVSGCKNKAIKGNGIRFFRFPAIKGLNIKRRELMKRRRSQWFTAINRKDISETQLSNKKICSAHFISGMPANIDDVDHPDWVPSVAVNTVRKSANDALSKRYSRLRNRNSLKSDQIESTEIEIIECEAEAPDTDSLINIITIPDVEVQTTSDHTNLDVETQTTSHRTSVDVETQTIITFKGTIAEQFLKQMEEISRLKKQNDALRILLKPMRFGHFQKIT